MKTFLRWQGNKSKHINKFKQCIPEFTGTYIEPFVGSGALLLKLQPKKWIINDLNKDLVGIWKVVRDNPNEVISYFKKFGKKFIVMTKRDKTDLCRKMTSELKELDYDSLRFKQYLLMIYCSYAPTILIGNKFYFNGLSLCIIRNKYHFLTDQFDSNLLQVSNFLQSGKIYNKDYKDILKKAKSSDFVFLDPPYIEECEYQFSYNKDEKLDDIFLKELLNEVKKLDTKDVKWLMTQADTQEVKKVFKEYTIHSFSVYRASKKAYVNELVITNY